MLSIAESHSISSILEEIVRGVAQASNLALARLWLVGTNGECPVCSKKRMENPAARALHLRGSAGHSMFDDQEYSALDGAFHCIKIDEERKIGQIAHSGRPMHIAHVAGDEPWVADREWIRTERIQSFGGQPLVFRGETLGVLAVFSRTALSEDEFKWLRTFADHAAVAIGNAKAFESLDRLKGQLQAENEYLHQEIRESLELGEMVGQSPSLRKVLDQVALVAEKTATVLIQGESGTGKELVARAIHERSARRDRPFIKVNCSAIPRELFESEFFGHVRGAFTSAMKDRVGRFELAHQGDLFLDEIAEIPLDLQSKLLRVLQEKEFERVGDGRTRTVDVRVIGATNRDLKREVERGRFREDLYYRLSVFPIEVPPLRVRKEDIASLARHFLGKSAAKMNWPPPRLTRENLSQLESYHWPGNVRELENVIERATILARHSHQLRFDLNPSLIVLPFSDSESQSMPPASPSPSKPMGSAPILTRTEIRQHEIDNILTALRKANGRIFGPGGAAEILRMRPTTLASRLKALGLKRTFVQIPLTPPPQ